MPNIKEVVHRIHSVKSTQQITKAMKMVAAAKLGKVQHQILHMRPYAEKLTAMLTNVMASTHTPLAERYTTPRAVERLLVVVMTADKGLCGAFNTSVLKKALQYLQDLPAAGRPAHIAVMPIGKKADEFFKKKDFPLIRDYLTLSQQLDFDQARQAATWLTDAFLQDKYDQVVLVYNQFHSAAQQVPCIEPLLPIPTAATDGAPQEVPTTYIYEPSKEALLASLIPRSLQIQWYKALLSSHASEHGARMTTMNKATDNAEELLKSLRITYNRTRQSAITQEIAEIVAGAEALIG